MLTPLRVYGHQLGRPEVDALKESSYANMKELRFRAEGGVWRVASAFGPARAAILQIAWRDTHSRKALRIGPYSTHA